MARVTQNSNYTLKDGKFGRPETQGIANLVVGIAMGHRQDEVRLTTRASTVFEDLREYFSRKEPGTKRDEVTRAGKDRT